MGPITKKTKLPRWAAPIAGAIVLPLISLRVLRRQNAAFEADQYSVELLAAAAIGFCIGLLVFLLDPRPSKAATQLAGPLPSDAQGSLVSRFLALASIVSLVFPPLALYLAIAAVYMNRRVVGWPKKVSWIALILSVLSSAVLLYLVILSAL